VSRLRSKEWQNGAGARSISCLRDHPVRGPPGGAAHIHVLDEAHLGAHPLAVLDKGHQLVVVETPHDHDVELERPEAQACHRLDPFSHAVAGVGPGEGREALGPERIEADRHPAQARVPEGLRLLRQQGVGP